MEVSQKQIDQYKKRHENACAEIKEVQEIIKRAKEDLDYWQQIKADSASFLWHFDDEPDKWL